MRLISIRWATYVDLETSQEFKYHTFLFTCNINKEFALQAFKCLNCFTSTAEWIGTITVMEGHFYGSKLLLSSSSSFFFLKFLPIFFQVLQILLLFPILFTILFNLSSHNFLQILFPIVATLHFLPNFFVFAFSSSSAFLQRQTLVYTQFTKCNS